MPGQAALVVGLVLRCFLPQRLDKRGYVPPVLGCQLVDAGDQEIPLLVARLVSGRCLVVVVQSRGLGRRGANHRNGHVESIVAGRGGRTRFRVVARV